MTKIIVFTLILAITIGLINYLIFFWINRRRIWKREDEEFNTLKRKEAYHELLQSNELLESVRDDYLSDIDPVKRYEQERL